MNQLEMNAIEETGEALEANLVELEREIATRFKIAGSAHVRAEILKGIKGGTIPEDGSIVHWLALYSTLLARLQDSPPMPFAGDIEKEAAESGLFFCLPLC